MTYMSLEATRMQARRTSSPRASITALGCWAVAVLGCHAASIELDSELLVFGARLAAILVSGALAGMLADHLDTRGALVAGMIWAALAITTEITIASQGVTGWYELLGDPSRLSDWMRGLTVVAWLLAPGIAARASE